jgi:uncharacterized protein YoxC
MIIEISILIICLAVLVLVLFLVPTIIQLKKSAKRIEEVSGQLNQQFPTILGNITEITSNLNTILSSGRQQVESLGEATQNVKTMVNDIVQFERRIRHQVQNPIIETLTTIVAITKAIQTFLTILLDRK